MHTWIWTITDSYPPERLDKAVTSAISAGLGTWSPDDEQPEVSRSRLQKLIEEGRVTLNSKPALARDKVQQGDVISLTVPEAEPLNLSPEDRPLEILYEDRHIAVVNKPAGLTVHPSETQKSDTLVNILLHKIRDLSGVGGVLRPGIVHRLDKDTSGALVIAKTTAALTRLSKLFLDREVHKTYLALVKGTPRTDTGRIDAPIRRSSKNRQQMAIHSGGRRAVTTFEIDHTWGWCSLLKVNIETGRTHQIRLHLASIGHPVLGDTTYGERAANAQAAQKLGLHRQWHGKAV
jgi:23S rRNA pseudouridine1911/1915/1917 synthase